MEWEKELDRIAHDNIHGATYLTKALVELAAKVEDIERFLKRAEGVQPYMASIFNFLADLKKAHRKSEDIKKFCQRWWQEFEAEHKRVVQKGTELIKRKSILVHSFSSAVYEAILQAQNVRVIATESRPKNEGVDLAKRLNEKGVDVELVIDAAAPYVVQDVDLVLFGADGVGAFGVVHKVGSFGIALGASRFAKPLYALAHPKKFWPKDFVLPKEPLKDPKEVCSCEFTVRNFYFDVTPLAFFTQIVD